MTTEITKTNGKIVESVVLNGDISKLSSEQKVQYYNALCERIGLDPLTQPFKLLKLQGREVLYADKGATQQLSKIYSISHEIIKKERIEDIYVVTVRATDKTGRYTDEDGAVTVGSAKGDVLCNLIMKAATKAKRRAVLALCGLGILDETEIETIPGAVTEAEIVEERISQDEKNRVLDMIADSGADIDKFCAYLGIDGIDAMPRSKFAKAMIALETKKNKANKAKAVKQ